MARPDEKGEEGIYNRMRQRKSKRQPHSWRWVDIIPFARDHAFMIANLEWFLLQRFRTTDNERDSERFRHTRAC
jgi:hypothetical protein